jgi:hypothetical protein
MRLQEKITQEDAVINQMTGDLHKSESIQQTNTLRQASNNNLGSLLRLFKSDFFDAWIAISYLFRYQTSGVHDYLCNELYNTNEDDIEFYLIQLWYAIGAFHI